MHLKQLFCAKTETLSKVDIRIRVQSRLREPDVKANAQWLVDLGRTTALALHGRLAAQMNQLLKDGTHPELLTQGRTVWKMKGTIPSNYWQITCLWMTWKLLSAPAPKISRQAAEYMSRAQKGVDSDSKGAKHQLLMDSRVCKSRKTNLCTPWIDYKNACALISHTWILECLELFKINRTLRAFLKNLAGLWETTLEANSRPITQVSIKYSIYQKDPPQLFCFGLKPLSQIITKSLRYRFRHGIMISHLVCVDDVKMYTKSEGEIDSLIHHEDLQH